MATGPARHRHTSATAYAEIPAVDSALKAESAARIVLAGRTTTDEARIKRLEDWMATMIVTPTIPPGPGVYPPAIPAGQGATFKKNFADGTLGGFGVGFGVATYSDLHPADDMEVYNRFANGLAQTSFGPGYVELRSTPRGGGLFDSALLATSVDNNGLTFGYGKTEFCAQAFSGRGTWPAGWLLNTTTWDGIELDVVERMEADQVAFHVHGPGAGGYYESINKHLADWKTNWHRFYVDRRATYCAFGMDGVELWRQIAAMPSTPLAIMLDMKIGFPWAEGPDASTPNPAWIRFAWVTQDP